MNISTIHPLTDAQQTWQEQIGAVMAQTTAVHDARRAVHEAERNLEAVKVSELLPELERGKEGRFNGSNAETRELQMAAFLGDNEPYQAARERLDAARDELRRAEAALDAELSRLSLCKELARYETALVQREAALAR